MARRPVNGILLLDKPVGITSNTALQVVKNLYNAKKAGHAGTLDPVAGGMLMICFGQYTKIAQYCLGADKTYTVTAKLGVSTETGDCEGEITKTKPVPEFTDNDIENVLSQFRGEISQVPSMYSALKHNGQPLYKLARQGIVVEREPRKIIIHALDLISKTNDTLTLSVRCSKGTYIRTLVEDIGLTLGCGGHVIALYRNSIGGFKASQCLRLSDLKRLEDEKDWSTLNECLLNLSSFEGSYPEVEVTESKLFYLQRGQPISESANLPEGLVLLKHFHGQYLGFGEVLPGGKIISRKLLSCEEVAVANRV